MVHETPISPGDSRAIIRLLGQVAAHPGDFVAKKVYLMDGLCELIDADRWLWGLSAQMEPGKPSVHIGLLYGGFTEATLASFIQAYTHPEMSSIHEGFARELKEKGTQLTRLRQQIDPEDRYKQTAAFPYWQAADINGIILSFRPLGETISSGLGLYRSYSRDLFSPRENRIAHIVLSSVPELHAQGWPDDYGVSVPQLSARQRTIMTLLIQGYTRRKIADYLGLSPHTVNEYVKGIYAHLGVHSQAGLISHFRHGDGGDV